MTKFINALLNVLFSTFGGKGWGGIDRLLAMGLAMKKLDKEGLIASNQFRDSFCIVVKVMLPEDINREIALRLNKSSTIIKEGSV